MVFADDDQPEASFVIPKSSFRHGKAEAVVSLGRDPGIYQPLGFAIEPVLAMPNRTSAGDVVTWVGVPVEGMTGEASRAVAVLSPGTTTTEDSDLRREKGDQHGKLIVRDGRGVIRILERCDTLAPVDAERSRNSFFSENSFSSQSSGAPFPSLRMRDGRGSQGHSPVLPPKR